MADNLAVTPGTGATIAFDDVSAVLFQKIKLDMGGDGVSVPLVGDATYGLPIDVKRCSADVTTLPKSGQVWPINDNGGSLTVDGSVTIIAAKTAPPALRLSDGTDWLTGLTVSGTVTVNQGTAVAVASGWPAKITDGTDTVGISSVSTARALKVDVIQSVATGGSSTDEAAFTDGSGSVMTHAGLYKDTAGDPSSGQVAAVRITQKRGLHVNLRAAAGTEVGTSGAPIRTDPTGGTTQPVSGTVAATQSGAWTADLIKIAGSNISAAATGIPKVGLTDEAGNAYTDANPLPVEITASGRTRVTKEIAATASQSDTMVWTPASGKRVVITSVQVNCTTAGVFELYDGTDAAANRPINGTFATGNREFGFGGMPWVSSAQNNVLKWTTGAFVGAITIHGYEEA